MARRKIREYDGRRLFADFFQLENQSILVDPQTNLDSLPNLFPWLKSTKLVAKPDVLMGKKGKNNLILLNADFISVKKFLKQHLGKELTITNISGELSHFILQPFVEHKEEYFVSIVTGRDYDTIYLSPKGGVDIEENWQTVSKVEIPINDAFPSDSLKAACSKFKADKEKVASFVQRLYEFFVDYDFSYLELNPFCFSGEKAIPLGFVGELDDCAEYKNYKKWSLVDFPQGFGRAPTKEEKFIEELDSKTGASLKLTVINSQGRIWPLVAGGGASVIYADTVVDLGFGKDLAVYGEYSGDPNEEETYQYARTVLDLMTRNNISTDKILLIGGGVANFTDVAKTFKGIIRALTEYKEKLQKTKIKIYVRRGGPNYEVGLSLMKELGKELNLPIEVYGPETHMTKIISLALVK